MLRLPLIFYFIGVIALLPASECSVGVNVRQDTALSEREHERSGVTRSGSELATVVTAAMHMTKARRGSNTTAASCPAMTPTDNDSLLECGDGTQCDATKFPLFWACCKPKGGRAKCPRDHPVMCKDITAACVQDHCCLADCTKFGGPYECSEQEVIATRSNEQTAEVLKNVPTFTSGGDDTILCRDFDVKLANSSTTTDGTTGEATVYIGGRFQPICGSCFWDNDNGAAIVCKKLGYAGGVVSERSGTNTENAVGITRCDDQATNLDECNGCDDKGKDKTDGWFPTYCHAGKGVKFQVLCTGATDDVDTKETSCMDLNLAVTTLRDVLLQLNQQASTLETQIKALEKSSAQASFRSSTASLITTCLLLAFAFLHNGDGSELR